MNEKLETRYEPIPGYRLVERLGRGGYGEVWKVEAPGGFLKAMKFVFGSLGADDRNSSAKQELRALSRILNVRHPFILSMERFDVVDGQLLIVMELADRNLQDRMNECRGQGLDGVPRDELLGYMEEAAEALDLMNMDYDLQHLDIKPANLFLVRKHLKVADFGMVRDLLDRDGPSSGGLTPLYAPPEAYAGKASRSSDQYSLAIVFQEMLTGVRPIAGDTARQLMFHHLSGAPNLQPLPEADRAIVGRALAKKPDDRFPSCDAFIDALRKANEAAGETDAGPLNAAETVRQRASLADEETVLTLEPPHPRPPWSRRAGAPSTKSGSGLDRTPHGPDSLGRTPHSDSPAASRSLTDSIAARIQVQIDPDGALCPTLIIGVGRTGMRVVQKVRLKLRQRFGEAAVKLPVRYLSFDSDPNAAVDVDKLEAADPHSHAAFALCKLRKGSEYRSQWESLKHLSSWFREDQLVRIPASGETRGLRGLGRLALVDNYARSAGRLCTELANLTSAQTAADADQVTNLRYRQDRPRIVVAAGMGGGTGAGMSLDLCFLVRAIMTSVGENDPDVVLMLLAGIAPTMLEEPQRVNQYALAQDLLTYSQPGEQFRLPVDLPGIVSVVQGPPARAMVFFDASADHLVEPKEATALDAMAEFVSHSAIGAFGKNLDQRLAGAVPFHSLGWFALNSPTGPLLRAAGLDFAGDVIRRWLVNLEPEEIESARRHAKELVDAANLSPAKLSDLLKRAVADLSPRPFHEQAAEQINQLIEALHGPPDKQQLAAMVRTTRTGLRRLLGGDPVDDEEVYDSEPLWDRVYREGANRVADVLFAPLLQALQTLGEETGVRLDLVRAWWLGLSEALSGMFERFRDLAKSKEAERKAYEAAYQVHRRLVLGGAAKQYVKDLENYVREKMAFRHREQIGQIFLLLNSRVQALSGPISAAPRKLEGALALLKIDRMRATILNLGLNQQMLFPGGAVELDEAVEETKRRRGAEALNELESRLRHMVLTPRGGLWAACASPTFQDEEMAEAIASTAASWLQEYQTNADVAAAFFDRHADSVETAGSELGAFFDWSKPSLAVRSPASANADAEQEFVTLLVAAPESPAGRRILEAIRALHLLKDVRLSNRGEEEILFVRFASHGNLGRLLPLWLLKAKTHYDAACQGRFTPKVFPEFSESDGRSPSR